MRTVNTRDLRDNLAECLDAAQSGEPVVVTRRGRPVAQIVRAAGGASPSPALARALARGEIQRAGDVEALKALLDEPPTGKRVNLVDQVLADRGP